MITIKSKREIELMREAGRIASHTLDMIEEHIKPGVSTEELNQLCHDFIISHDAIPAPLIKNTVGARIREGNILFLQDF